MNSNSRAAKILQLSLAQNKSSAKNNDMPKVDISTKTAADIMDNILHNDTDNNCIDLDVLEQPSHLSPSYLLDASIIQDTALDLTGREGPIISSVSDAPNIAAIPNCTSTPKKSTPELELELHATQSVHDFTPSINGSLNSSVAPAETPIQQPQTNHAPEIEEENLTSTKRKTVGPEGWKQNVMKRRREHGLEYEMRNGTMANARVMGEICNCKSGSKQCSSFSEDERSDIFKHVWSLSWNEKRNFVFGLVDQMDIKRRRSKDNQRSRQYTFQYSLKSHGQKRSVCLKMFLSTTGLTKHFVSSLFQNKDSSLEVDNENDQTTNAPIVHAPKKQRMNPHYKRSEESRRILHQFFDELQKMPSHYCRQSSSKLYVQREFKTYVDVHTSYVNYCSKKNVTPLQLSAFKKDFHERNLSLFVPKKDRCNLCIGHEVGNIAEDEWKAHMDFKEKASAEKARDKEQAIKSFENGDRKFAAFCMDLESVLLAPSTEANAMYFKTKLTVHNFTVYNLASGAVSCYVWNETEGGMTASEFASCILDYLKEMERYDHVVIYSDGCTYQNRNAVLANAIQAHVNATGTIIEHKYLVRGHTHMEVDNSHSLIERALRGRTINVPYDYVNIMQQARKKPSPFLVKYLTFDFFKNFNGIGPYDSIRPGKKVGDPTVTDVHAFRYSPDCDGAKIPLKYKLTFDEEYKDIPLPRDFEKRQPGTPSQLYNEKLKIPKSKFQHLQELKDVIGKDYHAFYDQLSYK